MQLPPKKAYFGHFFGHLFSFRAHFTLMKGTLEPPAM